jgi:vancomycin permeability regulator SanA
MRQSFSRLVVLGTLVFMTMALVIGLIGLQDRVGKAEIAVVLDAFIQSNGQPSARLHARLEKAAELYKKGFFSTIIVSGGVRRNGFDEAAIMKDNLLQDGIPPQHILVDRSGYTTYLTAKNTARLMRERHMQSVFIISQFYHLPRCRLAFHRFGVPVEYCAHANYFERNDIYFLAREVFAISYYALRGY